MVQSPVLSCLLALEGRTEDRTEDRKLKRPEDRIKTAVGISAVYTETPDQVESKLIMRITSRVQTHSE